MAAPAPPPSTGLRLYVLNLCLLITLGLLLSGWLLYFTDWFPVVGGLLGLGGLFAWIAFLSGLLRNERKEEMQDRFEALVLGRHKTWLIVAAILVGFLLWASSRGTVVVDAIEDSLGRTLKITPANVDGAQPIHQDHLPARQTQKYVVPTAWFGSRPYRVKVSGLPAWVVDVHPLGRAEVSVPSSFLSRPVVLLTLTPTLNGLIAEGRDTFDAEVTVGGKPIGGIEGYKGESLWIGADSEVAIPQAAKERWRLEMMKVNSSAETMRAFDVALIRWTTTREVAPDLVLKPGDSLSARVVRRADKVEVARGEGAVRALSGAQDFPQEIRLEKPRPADSEVPHAPPQ